MIFGFIRRKAATADAISAVRPLMALLKIRGPVPTEALHDPYVLGFLQIVVLFHVTSVVRGDRLDDFIGDAMQAVHKEIGGTNHLTISEAHIRYATDKHPDFMRGQGDADKVIGLMHGFAMDRSKQPLMLVNMTPNPEEATWLIHERFVGRVNQIRDSL